MNVIPAHLNKDSFRHSFKGLAALEIILELPFGFPINDIISLCQRKKAVSPRSYPISQHTYKPLYIVRMFENIYAEISPSRFFGPSECLVPTPWLTSEYPTCNVRVCAYTHTYTHVHSHHRQKIEKVQTTPL